MLEVVGSNYIQIETTFSKREEAMEFAEKILDAKLVADGQVSEIFTVYNFEGRRHSHSEFLLSMKTRAELFAKCEQFIKLHHPYKVPQIVALPIECGSKDYLDWIDENAINTKTVISW